MRAIIKSIGPCRMKFSPPEFHRLAQSIVYQQLNGRAAETIFRRFTAMAGEPLNPPSILQLTEQQMRAAGLSKQKSAYLKDLAAKTANGSLNFAQLPTFSDAEVIDHLIQVKGIGVWTAQMFLMFTLRRENVLPTGDYGVRMAMYKRYLAVPKASKKVVAGKKARKKTVKLPTPAEMEKIAKCWEPYRSVACWYLWRSLDAKTL